MAERHDAIARVLARVLILNLAVAGAKLVFDRMRGRFSRLKLVWADGIYERIAGWVAAWRPARPIRLLIVKRTEPGFRILRRRWVVERTFLAGSESAALEGL